MRVMGRSWVHEARLICPSFSSFLLISNFFFLFLTATRSISDDYFIDDFCYPNKMDFFSLIVSFSKKEKEREREREKIRRSYV